MPRFQKIGSVKVRKVYGLKIASLEANCLSGSASGIGNMDRGGDVIFPGFYADALDGFAKSGFVAVGHDWNALPVAMPTSAEEKGTQLLTKATFHSTQAAQDARTVCMERKSAGLDVGLSVGFSMNADGYKMFRSGADLLAYATENKCDLTLFDVEGITAWTGSCRGLLKCAELFEYSIVTVPMNPEALATEAKGLLAMKGVKFYAPGGYIYDPATGEYEYVTNTAASAAVGAMNQVYYDLADDVASILGDDSLSADEIGDAIEAEMTQFAKDCSALARAIVSILSTEDDETKAAIISLVRMGAPSRRSIDGTPDSSTKTAAEGEPTPSAAPDTEAMKAVKAAIARTLANLARANGVTL